MGVFDHARPPRRVNRLSGMWQVQPGEKDRIPGTWDHTVRVPGLVDLATPAYAWDAYDYHWYRTTFSIQEAAERDTSSTLLIEQAMYGTEVWLNRIHVGGDIGCYTSQEYDVRPALNFGGVNELVVRVGARRTLPPESAVGKDQERSTFPSGIWGDVGLIECGSVRIALVQMIPRLPEESVTARVRVENRSDAAREVVLRGLVREKHSGAIRSMPAHRAADIPPRSATVLECECSIRDVRHWSPENPFLYEFVATLETRGETVDALATTFGMRSFEVREGGFFLNGKRIFLRGGNIAFHRFLADPDRAALPWDEEWIRRVLIDIPKAHNFNFFRSHLGQMYNRWYDLADEHGILIQNEWQFWTTTGTPAQIRREFTRWLEDNWNHPSIVIWDPLNESTDRVVQEEIVPEMKLLDPTRPWESVDVVEEHPYIYSLGPVLNGRRFGFARSLQEIETSASSTMLNEFLWWWLDRNDEPTSLMRDVIERWLGPSYTREEVIRRQSFLAAELIELFRRMRVDAIQPFVYLSNSDGPTGNWFSGDIARCRVKPVMGAVANAFSPFGLSLELWDRHFVCGEGRHERLHLFNDDPVTRSGKVRYGVAGADGSWVSSREVSVSVGPGGHAREVVDLQFPASPGRYRVRAELLGDDGHGALARTEKEAFVFSPPLAPGHLRKKTVALLAATDDIRIFLGRCGIPCVRLQDAGPELPRLLVVAEGLLAGGLEPALRERISRAVVEGGTLILLEPEYGVSARVRLPVAGDCALDIEPRYDVDKGGYDSYVFPVDARHPVWSGILPEHLRMFNGGWGGEAVSEHRVTPTMPEDILARCGLNLAVTALSVVRVREGRAVICRIQSRGRLVTAADGGHLYARREDPVIQQLILNILSVWS